MSETTTEPGTKRITVDVPTYFTDHSVPRFPSMPKVWAWLMDNSRNGRKNYQFPVSLNRLAKEAEVSRRTAQRSIAKLVEMSVLGKDEDPGEGGVFVYVTLAKEIEVTVPDPDYVPPKEEVRVDAAAGDVAGEQDSKAAQELADATMAEVETA